MEKIKVKSKEFYDIFVKELTDLLGVENKDLVIRDINNIISVAEEDDVADPIYEANCSYKLIVDGLQ